MILDKESLVSRVAEHKTARVTQERVDFKGWFTIGGGNIFLLPTFKNVFYISTRVPVLKSVSAPKFGTIIDFI